MNKQNFYHPKFIPTWILIVFMKLGARLPFKAQVLIGIGIGRLLYPLLSRFRKIAFVNIAHCFPHKSLNEVESLVKQNFEAIGISLFETANAYFAKNDKVQKLISLNNEHYLTDALDKKQGVILLTAHFMPLMLGSRALLLKHKIANIYRPQNNPLFDEVMRKGFVDNGATMIKTKDTRSMMKAIKNGLPIWYAPDQDLGEKNSVFAPFFNIQTATIAATARLAKVPNTVVIPYFFIRTASGYTMTFESPLSNYPVDDAIENATRTNQILQEQILKAPEQYLWIHRRFKTRPKGETSFY
ncbi:MAG TPA: LpxL/LpxP family Kdo(2)-lipid IV(A) lauroyl/palmitoleoyl acyltransferase [Gammaproteobacteria bacterium]|nr:LpxL/LpxP family Kdo(2)-lipid IV(A) lauroyl/palmitoleoyl acyltransferase [Gammaproteobacteria bacterium]